MNDEDFSASHISYEHVCDIATFFPILFEFVTGRKSQVTAHVLDGAKQHLEKGTGHVLFEYDRHTLNSRTESKIN